MNVQTKLFPVKTKSKESSGTKQQEPDKKPSYVLLKKIIKVMSLNDQDYALYKNNIGFMHCDVSSGHFLDNMLEKYGMWRREWAKKAHYMLRKYATTQIPRLGIDYDTIPLPDTEPDEWIEPPEPEPYTWEEFETFDFTEKEWVPQLHKFVEKCFGYDNDRWQPFYAENKNELRGKGYGMSNYGTGDWYIVRYTDPEPEPEKEISPIEWKKVNLEPLYDYQQEHAKALIDGLNQFGAVLDGSGTGTGKTPTAAVVCRELNLKPFVLCPKAVIPGWEKWFKRLDMKYLGVVNYELGKRGKYRKQDGFYSRGARKGQQKIVNVNCPWITVKKNPRKGQWEPKYIITVNFPDDAIVIFDEAHRCKNKNTINTQLMITVKESGVKIMDLSATIGEDPLKMFGIARVLDFYKDPWEYYSWITGYGCYKDVVNSQGQEAWLFDGKIEHMRKLHEEIYGVGKDGARKGSRMDIEELIKQGKFPETVIYAETYDIGDENIVKVNNLYEKIKAENIPIVARLQARMEVERIKGPAIAELAQDMVEEGNSVVIFLNYTDPLKMLCDKLKTDCTIYGGNDSTTNETNRKRFQDNKERIIICNIQAAGESIDLHDVKHKYPRISIISPTDSAQGFRQVLGRIQRSGGTKSQQRIFFAARTVEEEVCENVNKKIDRIDVLNTGDLTPK